MKPYLDITITFNDGSGATLQGCEAMNIEDGFLIIRQEHPEKYVQFFYSLESIASYIAQWPKETDGVQAADASKE